MVTVDAAAGEALLVKTAVGAKKSDVVTLETTVAGMTTVAAVGCANTVVGAAEAGAGALLATTVIGG